jgi:hypothetical protein
MEAMKSAGAIHVTDYGEVMPENGHSHFFLRFSPIPIFTLIEIFPRHYFRYALPKMCYQ